MLVYIPEPSRDLRDLLKEVRPLNIFYRGQPLDVV
jgi:hypothetical protein